MRSRLIMPTTPMKPSDPSEPSVPTPVNTAERLPIGGRTAPPEPATPPHPHPTQPHPLPVPPPQPPTSLGQVTSSITSWTRLEPHCRDADMRATLGARVFDPLWMLTRQWQVGEFQAEDAGMPVMARLRGTSALFSRCALGAVQHD